MQIRPGDLDDREVTDFLQAHVAQLRSLGPPESTHVLDLNGLRAADVRFYTAYDGGELVGCAALKQLSATLAELKSMRTAPHRTREGIAARLLQHVLAEARSSGFARVSLESGSDPFFHGAHALYRRHGFVVTDPFGAYQADPLSTFMTRVL